MKLSLLFLSTALIVPISEASLVDLTDRWTIGEPTATNSGNTFTFQYPGMSNAWLGDSTSDKIRATIYDGGCKVDGSTWDGTTRYGTTGYWPNDQDNVPSTTSGSGEQPFRDNNLVWSTDNLLLTYTFTTNPRVMTAMGDFGSGPLLFCVRLGLYAGGSITEEINFYESIVTLTIDFQGDFAIAGFGVAPKIQGQSTAAQEYKVVASLCTDDQQAPTDLNGNFNQGAAIKVCISLDDQAKSDCVELKSVDNFSWTREDTSTTQEAITSTGEESTNGLTLLGDIDNTVGVGVPNVVITSVLFAKFYTSEGDVTANGAVTMAFGDSCGDTGEEEAQVDCLGEIIETSSVTLLDFSNSVVKTNTLHIEGGELRYEDIGIVRDRAVSLVVTVASGDYTDIATVWADRDKIPDQQNGKNGLFAQINLQTVEDKPKSGEGNFRFCFHDKETDDVVKVDRFDFTVFDIDNRGDSGLGRIEERLLIDAAHPQSYRLWPNIADSEVIISCEDGTAILPCGEGVRTVYQATTLGTGGDNPGDPNNLSVIQKRRSIAFQFTDTNCFEFTYDHYCPSEQIDEGGDGTSCNGRYNGGNFLFAGAADEIITDGECAVTPTLAPTVDPLTNELSRRLGSSSNNNNINNNIINRSNKRTLQEGDAAIVAPFEITASLNKADDGPVALQQTAGGTGTSITVVTTTIVGLVSAILLA